MLAFDRRSERTHARRVVGTHLIGGGAGLAAWWAQSGGTPLAATPAAFSAGGFRPAASATASIVLTNSAMIATDTIHPPACATTPIVLLGLLSSPTRVGIIVASVVLLVGFLGAVVRLFDRRWATTPQDYPGPD